jgi:alpha-1,3-rhamnosyl/mannosyltransferase
VTRALAAVASEPGAPQLYLFVPNGFLAAHGRLVSTATRVETSPTSGHVRPVRVAVERTWLRHHVHHARPDLVHHAGGTAPFGRRGRHPRTVVSIHDIQFVSHPEHFSTIKRRWLAAQAPRAVHRADIVTVPTAWVGRTLVEHFDAEPERIHVVPHAPPPELSVSDDAIIDVRRRYDLPGPYLLFPAVTYPHKNHVVLLEAMCTLRRRHPDLRLVLTGGEGRAEVDVAAGIAGRALGAVVRRTGRVTDDDRDALLAGASVLVFPSRYEGFGAPVVEAMAAGVPVAAASATALPEVVGDAARLVDPDDIAGWVDVIEQLLADDGARAELIAAGRRRVAGFAQQHTATALHDAYRAALDRDR